MQPLGEKCVCAGQEVRTGSLQDMNGSAGLDPTFSEVKEVKSKERELVTK